MFIDTHSVVLIHTPDRQQWKTLFRMNERGSKIAKTVFLIAIDWRQMAVENCF